MVCLEESKGCSLTGQQISVQLKGRKPEAGSKAFYLRGWGRSCGKTGYNTRVLSSLKTKGTIVLLNVFFF